MNAKKADFQERKERVLGIVVDEYIKNTTPVGSHFIVQRHSLDLSPATIRNILADLEEEGYLTHPHTSAGRIPTEMGYRYYVDHLMDQIQLLEEEKARLHGEYAQGMSEVEALLDKVSQNVSEITHCTSIIALDGWGTKMICKGTSFVVNYPEEKDLDKIRAILRALEQKEQILGLINRELEQRVAIYIGHEMALKEMEGCSLAVARFNNRGAQGRIAVLGPTRMDYERVVSALDYICDLISRGR